MNKHTKKKIKKQSFITEFLAMAKKIEWPDKKTLLKSLVAVLIVSVIITGYLMGLDVLFVTIRNLILFR